MQKILIFFEIRTYSGCLAHHNEASDSGWKYFTSHDLHPQSPSKDCIITSILLFYLFNHDSYFIIFLSYSAQGYL